MPLIYYRASLQGTAEGEDAVSFISSDTNKQFSLNRSRSPSIKPAASEGTTSHKVSTESAVLRPALTIGHTTTLCPQTHSVFTGDLRLSQPCTETKGVKQLKR